jgi:hypothetical protein
MFLSPPRPGVKTAGKSIGFRIGQQTALREPVASAGFAAVGCQTAKRAKVELLAVFHTAP